MIVTTQAVEYLHKTHQDKLTAFLMGTHRRIGGASEVSRVKHNCHNNLPTHFLKEKITIESTLSATLARQGPASLSREPASSNE